MLDLNFTFRSKLKVPAWRSILVLAIRSYLGKFARQGMIKGAFCSNLGILKRYEGEGKQRGAQSIP